MNIPAFLLVIMAPIYFIIAALHRFYISNSVSKKKWKSKEIVTDAIFTVFFIALIILNFLFYNLERPYLLWIIESLYTFSLILVLRNLIFVLIKKDKALNKIIKYNRQIIIFYLILAIISSIAAIFL